MRDNLCPKCGSQAIMADVEVRDRGRTGPQPLRVYIQEPEPPDHGFIWSQGEAYGDVRAWVCATCGYTELYTGNLSALYDFYRKGQS